MKTFCADPCFSVPFEARVLVSLLLPMMNSGEFQSVSCHIHLIFKFLLSRDGRNWLNVFWLRWLNFEVTAN
jgi:hypothetical protein